MEPPPNTRWNAASCGSRIEALTRAARCWLCVTHQHNQAIFGRGLGNRESVQQDVGLATCGFRLRVSRLAETPDEGGFTSLPLLPRRDIGYKGSEKNVNHQEINREGSLIVLYA